MGKGATDHMANRETLTVKNTFIEVDDGLFEGDGADFVEATAFAAKRQQSEPASVFGRPVPGLLHMRSLQERGASQEQEAEHSLEGDEEGEEAENTVGWGQHWSEEGDGYTGGQMMGGDCMQFQPMGMQNGQPIFAGAVMMPLKMDSDEKDPMAAQLPQKWAQTFTVMMRNLPNRYTQLMLLEEISSAGFAGTFDFLYLPIDPDTHANKGYAFINFVDPVQAWRFKGAYEGQQMKCFNSSKFVSVNPAALQGLEANYAHYSTARCSRGNPSARPLFFREPQQKFTPRNAARRGGHRRRVNARSLVDVAVQRNELLEEQDPMPQPQQGQGQVRQDLSAATQGPSQGGGGGSGQGCRFCPYCGGATRPSYRFCKFCGASLEGLEVLLTQALKSDAPSGVL